MTTSTLRRAFARGAQTLIENENYFSELDAKTGDGDHGVTIAKIGKAILPLTESTEDIAPAEFFFRIFDEIMRINGGSIGPLWALMADGAANAVTEEEVTVERLLKGALAGLREVSQAKAGEKTLIDPLLCAIEAVEKESDEKKHAALAAQAAMEAAENTRNMQAKFGRAKNLPDKGLGFLDPGAVSLAYFISALAGERK